MADKKLTDATITLLAHPAKSDYLYIVSDPAGSPISKKIYAENAMEALNLGWLWVAASGTYLSASTFRVTGDFTAYFKIGAKVKLSNTTTKYFYVASSSYSSPYTTVTVLINTTYTVANTTLTNVYLSYANPPDFPSVFALATPTFSTTGTAFTNQPTSNWRLYIGSGIALVSGGMQNHATSGGTGIFIATFAAGTLPPPAFFNVGHAINLSNGKAGPAYISTSTPNAINMYDSSAGSFGALAGNSELYQVTVAYNC